MKNKHRWYRKFVLDVDKETVKAAVANSMGHPEQYSVSSLTGPYVPDDTDALNGKTLVFKGEDKTFTFNIAGPHDLKFSENGGEEISCWSNVKTMDNEVFLVNFLVPGYEFSRQITLIADMKSGCATVDDAHFGTENSNIDVDNDFIFGRLESASGNFEGGELHGFTNDLVGTAIEWDYGKLKVKHMYTSNVYYTYANSSKNGEWMATNPADYVKIRDNIFLFVFVEERQHGLQGLFLIDTDKCHDIGVFYGVSGDHIMSSCIGAIGTPSEITHIF
ncbi:MAG: MoaF N-terminal domain-containing protein [Parasporobacterium sp.]|nr:MoaF N-terminal domain-containing protein [Parasporobacterium sp.]